MASSPHYQPPWMKWPSAMKMGLRSCSAQDWLSDDDAFGSPLSAARQREEKASLFAHKAGDISGALSGSWQAGEEAFELIAQNRYSHHHHKLKTYPHEHPVISAGRQIIHDLLLLAPEQHEGGERWVLKAGVVGFPAHWRLHEKLGCAMDQIHAPVPHYADRLEHPVNRFFSHMRPGLFSRRSNWTLQIDEALHTPSRPPSLPLTASDVGNRLFIRTETQSFCKLPLSGHILFTIRTSLCAISRWQDEAEALQALLATHEAMSPQMAEYRNIESYLTPLRQWVHGRLTGAGSGRKE